jgi:hypothetical protein
MAHGTSGVVTIDMVVVMTVNHVMTHQSRPHDMVHHNSHDHKFHLHSNQYEYHFRVYDDQLLSCQRWCGVHHNHSYVYPMITF